jgi:putative transposase
MAGQCKNIHFPGTLFVRYTNSMPGKNCLKTYIENGYYHIYNRGVEKRAIFQDDQDYAVFISYLKEYLLPKDETKLRLSSADPHISGIQKDKFLKTLNLKNYNQDIMLLAYCLMPNHFHFFLKQNNPESISKFMRSLCTRYVIFFNRKYQRVGSLFQDVYKAVLINNESQFIHISRYIHKQAADFQGDSLEINHPCSFPEYIGIRHTPWIHPEEILDLFSKTNPELDYQNFVREYMIPNTLDDMI